MFILKLIGYALLAALFIGVLVLGTAGLLLLFEFIAYFFPTMVGVWIAWNYAEGWSSFFIALASFLLNIFLLYRAVDQRERMGKAAEELSLIERAKTSIGLNISTGKDVLETRNSLKGKSIGEMLDESWDLVRNGYSASVYGNNQLIRDIIVWFDQAIKKEAFYMEYEKNTYDGINNYAMVMKNQSGIDLWSFSFTLTPFKDGRQLPDCKASIEQWRAGTTGKILFYCPVEYITKIDIDAKNIYFDVSDTTRTIREADALITTLRHVNSDDARDSYPEAYLESLDTKIKETGEFTRKKNQDLEENEKNLEHIIQDEDIRSRLYSIRTIELAISHMGDDLKQNSRVHKFSGMYIPWAIDLCERYQKLEAQGVDGDKLSELKSQILKSIDVVIKGWDILKEQLDMAEIMEIKADTIVLESKVKGAGFGERDFKC